MSEHTFPSLNANGLTTSMKAEKKKSNQSKREKNYETLAKERIFASYIVAPLLLTV